MERELADENISAYERLRFEIEHCGTPISTFADLKNEYAVLDIDNRFSPKVRLYSIATARIGIMKIRQELFKRLPLTTGSILRLIDWERKPCYHFLDGKARPDHDRSELWLTRYEILV